MDKIIIRGGHALTGDIKISGAKKCRPAVDGSRASDR